MAGRETQGAYRQDEVINSEYDYETVPRRQLEEQEVGVRGLPVCKDVSPEAEERPLLEDVTDQSCEDRDWEH
jgi:hypothetical protein